MRASCLAVGRGRSLRERGREVLTGSLLAAAPARRPLLQKGIHAFRGVLEKHPPGHRGARELVRRLERPLELLVERALAEADDGGASRQNDVGKPLHGCVELVRRHDAVDEAPGERGGRVDGLAGQKR